MPAMEHIDSNSVIERLVKTQDGEIAPPHISTVGFVTTDRLETLKRGLCGYIENSKRYDRTNNFVVMDDSWSIDARNHCRQMLKHLKVRYAAEILYAGFEEKLLFLKRLIDTGDLPSEVTKFAVFDTEKTSLVSVGANRNSLLLHTVGEVIVSADDDTECAVAVHEMDAGLAFSSGRVFDSSHPCKFWTYPDREAVKRSLNFVETDFCQLMNVYSERASAVALPLTTRTLKLILMRLTTDFCDGWNPLMDEY
jgi:hypothetical protein